MRDGLKEKEMSRIIILSAQDVETEIVPPVVEFEEARERQ